MIAGHPVSEGNQRADMPSATPKMPFFFFFFFMFLALLVIPPLHWQWQSLWDSVSKVWARREAVRAARCFSELGFGLYGVWDFECGFLFAWTNC